MANVFFFQSQRKIKVSFQAAFPQVPADLFQLVPSVTCGAGSGAADQSCKRGSATRPACSLGSSLAARTGVLAAICNAASAPSSSRGIVPPGNHQHCLHTPVLLVLPQLQLIQPAEQ